VVRVHIGTDRETGKSRGFAFVEYGTDAEAADAIRRFDGHDLGGRRLRVNDADDRPPARAAAGPRPMQAAPSFSAPRDMFAAGDPFGGEGGLGGGRSFKSKGSRRGLRARKRSLGY
jgi:RNA recognition motif-containing protein